ncbi:MAG TPA: FAD-dependent tricarballylate dehydrogenase TcuA [Acidimicrobiales bacterium]|nr:FAD-dependent tricarballylate dehydrogenase TcuA [Acidimicrobiales bacterium]
MREEPGTIAQNSKAVEFSEDFDVVVIGGGNAALVAAMSARHYVKRVLVLERAPYEVRGGNTRHTRNIRCIHPSADAYNTGSYLYDELWDDLCRVGSGPSDERLAELTVCESESVPGWMSEHGIHWQAPLSGTLHLGRTNRFFLGGGKALLNTYYRTLSAMSIDVSYSSSVEGFVDEGDRITHLLVEVNGKRTKVGAKAVVCASGGFEANFDWLARYWGPSAYNYLIRGPIYNDGTVLSLLYDLGAARAGQERGFHAVAIDARSPRFDGGIATRIDAIPFSVVLNRHAERFYDEGEDLWPKRYAIWGTNIALQDGQIAYAIWDSKVVREFLPPMYGPTRSATLAGIANAVGLSAERLERTILEYNAAIVKGTPFDPTRLDGAHTSGLEPEKTNWALPIDQPPYYAIAMRPGITFTYMGVKIDGSARIQREDGSHFANVFAAGEMMSGNVLSSGYLAGFGLTIGSVWGRIAGREAARYVSN